MVVLETAAIIGLVGWVAAPVFTRLISKVDSYVVKKYKWHKDLPEKLETLGHLLDEIGSTVSLVEAAGRINNHGMVCWLSQLKGAIDEVMDIFDILDSDIVESNRQFVDPADEASTGSIGSDKSLESLKELLKKLEDIRQSSRSLVQASMLAVTVAGCSDGRSRSTSRPVTGPSLPSDPLGYKDQYQQLLTWLAPDMKILEDDPYNDRAVVAIIGHGGMGKTTLAQRAWNDPRVKERFGLVIWASLYNKFGEADLLGEIWRSVQTTSRATPPSRRHGDMSFGSIQQALEKLVASNRYLLVLDDVCNNETATDLQRRDAWSNVLAPFLRAQKLGSRVLVTTRAVICAQTLGASSSRRINLDGVDRQSFIDLLKRSVASGSKEVIRTSDLDEVLGSSTLTSEPEEPRWKRSPLSAKEIGFKLRNIRSKNTWAKILTTDCHENVISAHVSSYLQLPPHLQHCLAFLGLFPNNFNFQPQMLVKMWVAHGFISADGNAMEETAEQYFNDLLLRSFLQTVEKDKISYYVIHEQIHSMIRSVSANYFMMIQDNYATAKIPLTIRHLSVTTSCLHRLKNPSVLKKLRTFLVFRDSSPAITDIDKDLLRELKGIRVMDLTGTDVAALPPEIGNLIHLRYLALPNTIQMLPEKFSKLYHLQTLIGSNHDQTPEVHNPMKRDLAFKFHTKKKTSLEQLARMDSLRGTLELTGLDVVATKKDAQKGQLKNKKSLRVLKFCWSDPEVGISSSDLDVLEGLEPHSGLQELHIRRYRGTSSPCWLTNNCLNQLTHLCIINCRQWEVLPSFGHLPHLNHLQITEVKSVTQIDGNGLFKSLETLVLFDLESLTEWTTGATNSRFTSLKEIKIIDCPRFNKPPPFQSALISLKGCQLLKKRGTAIVPTQATS